MPVGRDIWQSADAFQLLQKRVSSPLFAQIESVRRLPNVDRKSTRLNSSHQIISYAVFCLKKKKAPRYTRTAQSHCCAGAAPAPRGQGPDSNLATAYNQQRSHRAGPAFLEAEHKRTNNCQP